MTEKNSKLYSRWIINNISVSVLSDESEIFERAKRKLKSAGIDTAGSVLKLRKRSIDARKKDNIKFVCSVTAITKESKFVKTDDILPLEVKEIEKEYGKEKLPHRPVIVGMGPAGMFCALILAENGYAPIVLERGDDVDARVAAVSEFYTSNKLDANSNIQFGAGGAGTFSDGKLVTRINDDKCSYVLEKFCEYGAHEEILYEAKPHIGSDVLRTVVKNLAKSIEEHGGEIRYRCRVDDISLHSGSANAVHTQEGEIPCGALVLAIGHSARDTYKMLMSKAFFVEPKPFSVGVRIEHLQEDIDRALYGKFAGLPKLKHGEYTLSYTGGERGVYTFCMCPGGEVVAAASEEGGVVVNGMSLYARNGRNANSAVCVSVFESDYGNSAEGAIEYQRNLERAAFSAGGNNYKAPLQTVGDFFEGKSVNEPKKIMPTYMGGENYALYDLNKIFPKYISDNLKTGLLNFDKKIAGFASDNAIISGVETRTSAPVRITRTEDRTAINFDNIYPCGEGAGYAGGITSAAIDGINTALAIMKKYAPINNS